MKWVKERWQEASTLNGVGGAVTTLLFVLTLAFLARLFGLSLSDILNDAVLATGSFAALVLAAVGLMARIKQITTPEPSDIARQANVEDVKQAISEIQQSPEEKP